MNTVETLNPDRMSGFDVIIIGGGAAGLMCAAESAKRGRQTLLIERNHSLGRKILISGGGRCNFTNIQTPSARYLSNNPHFAKSALARYTPNEFIELVGKHNIAYHEKTLGQLFCDESSRDILSMLTKECKEAGAVIECSVSVEHVTKDEHFVLDTSSGRYECSSLVIATGGLSIPKIGATNFGYRIAEQFGLNVITLRPALVPLIWSEEERSVYGEISGVSMRVAARIGSTEFIENMLFTHRGISGPAILQISSYWSSGEEIAIDLLPGVALEAVWNEHHTSKAEFATILSYHLPKRFVNVWSPRYTPSKPMNQLSDKTLSAYADALHNWKIIPVETEGYEKAEVTAGGVDTDELSSKTMEAKKVRGLYFIGEVVDVTGWLGGYNFQWAWASGYAAGQVV